MNENSKYIKYNYKREMYFIECAICLEKIKNVFPEYLEEIIEKEGWIYTDEYGFLCPYCYPYCYDENYSRKSRAYFSRAKNPAKKIKKEVNKNENQLSNR